MDNKLKFNGIYRGKVLATDASETQKLGRVKIEIYPMLIGVETAKTLSDVDGIATDVLPWAVPAMPLFAGAGDGRGCFVVPVVNAFVWVFFEEGDIHQPVYFAEAQTGTRGLPVERELNYPDVLVWKTPAGAVIYIDDTKKEIAIHHSFGGKTFGEGNFGDGTYEGCTVVKIKEDGTVLIDSIGEIVIRGTRINLNP